MVGCYIWYSLGVVPCDSPPINGQCTDFILFDVALPLPINRLTCGQQQRLRGWSRMVVNNRFVLKPVNAYFEATV